MLSSGRTGCHDLLCMSRVSRVLCGCNSMMRSRKEAYQHTDAMTSPQAEVAGYLGRSSVCFTRSAFGVVVAYSFLMNRCREWLLFGCLAAVPVACPRGAPEPKVSSGAPRTYLMGFSVIPPRPDLATAVRSLDCRGPSVPMRRSCTSTSRGRSFSPVIRLKTRCAAMESISSTTIDRSTEAHRHDRRHQWARSRERVTALLSQRTGASTEPSIQRLYRNYVRALVDKLHPDYLGLAAETNLIREIAPRPVYDAVVRMTNDAANDVRAKHPAALLPLYVSVQVETAWGKLGKQRTFAGIDQDLRDFPFMNVIGLSSYPYLGGFKNPEEIPLDYLQSGERFTKTPGDGSRGRDGHQSRRAECFRLRPRCRRGTLRARRSCSTQRTPSLRSSSRSPISIWATFPKPVPAILPLFATLGLVDANLQPKPALKTWDEVFARPLKR